MNSKPIINPNHCDFVPIVIDFPPLSPPFDTLRTNGRMRIQQRLSHVTVGRNFFSSSRVRPVHAARVSKCHFDRHDSSQEQFPLRDLLITSDEKRNKKYQNMRKRPSFLALQGNFCSVLLVVRPEPVEGSRLHNAITLHFSIERPARNAERRRRFALIPAMLL